MAAEGEDQSSLLGENGGEGLSQREDVSIEKRNLINLTKLSVKSLIEAAMKRPQALTDSNTQLRQLLIALEHCLKHRLKVKRNLLGGQRRSFWSFLEYFEHHSNSTQEFIETMNSTRSVAGVKTPGGRVRVWVRMSLMHKKLSDHFRLLSENKTLLNDWYESDSLMCTDECTVLISGLLMSLNVIDYSISLNGEEFDKPTGVFDLSLFLKDGNYLEKTAEDGELENDTEDDKSLQLAQLLDQKAYVEELNKKMGGQLERLQSRLQKITEENESMKEQLSNMIGSVEVLTQERDQLVEDKGTLTKAMEKKLETAEVDQKTELNTYIESRAGLNDLYTASQKNLEVEIKLRQQLEGEVDILKRHNEEKETALQLLEKSVHEKQDTIVTLRKQLEEMKSANMKIKTQLKISKETHQSDSVTLRNLEGKVSQVSNENKQLEGKLQETRSSLRDSEKTCREVGAKLQEVQLARNNAESDLSIEKQWRISLQAELKKEKDRVVELTSECKNFRNLKQEHSQLQEKYACLQESVQEQEIALVEMGKQLSLSQQKIIDMKETTLDSIWEDEKDVLECRNCKATFSVARRKHHCRNCGQVYCSSCSDNTMQLASSAKPVRVCDNCYQILLQRASK
ncbi:PREDICTED: RUN and FYVE domain-containing protein 2-like [Amphimedon queenslandica]|uniref:FYVE-type domain-containing protein n=1 Tax=Amphimedon queenslandica TaxID=400682 RepID=A0A1X7VQE4_AMPQE|nr:PREDICTED: RUN and FYVE domain-containing protein 2-like [Amphimedon queenslandica]|eukprot:XP_003383169.1 PREDICTED: RUN and FYVE domain-containing protein 2-like [Amphimedon queenslandica]